jgi:hypothetical protein
MMHATVRSQRGALHFIGEVNPYNLEVLRQYLRDTSREEGGVSLRIAVDADDQQAFAEQARRWLAGLGRLGVAVELQKAGDGTAPKPSLPSAPPRFSAARTPSVAGARRR